MAGDLTTITIHGKPVEGGYIYYTSADVPGFRFLGEPGEKDRSTMLGALLECYSLLKAAVG